MAAATILDTDPTLRELLTDAAGDEALDDAAAALADAEVVGGAAADPEDDAALDADAACVMALATAFGNGMLCFLGAIASTRMKWSRKDVLMNGWGSRRKRL